MKNVENIFDFYLKNKLFTSLKEESKKVLASILALTNYKNNISLDLSKIIKMIILNDIDVDKLSNKSQIKAIIEEYYDDQTIESKEAKKCLENAKNMKSKGIERDLQHIYGRLLLTIGIDIECNLKLDFDKLYERIIKISPQELEKEKQMRIKYCYHNHYDAIEEYAYLISFLEELTSIKLKKEQDQNEFEKKYEIEKKFYRSMPILSSVLEKTKKL